MSPLKVSYLRPGDVVRVSAVVNGFTQDKRHVYLHIGPCALGGVSDSGLLAGNAELVVRPRPVRKGDVIKLVRTSEERHYVARFGPFLMTTPTLRTAPSACDFHPESWTHADGSPIDWEGSE